MGNIGDTLDSGSIPAVGTSGTTYASELNLFLTEVKNRLEAQMPKASLAPGPLDLDGEALQNAGYLGLIDLGEAPTTPDNTFQCFDGEAYWVSAAGVVKLTDSGVVNVAGVGGITGDYGGVNPAQFRFVDADQEYYAYDDYGTGTWAYLWTRGLDLAKDATSTSRIRLLAPSGLTSSYTLTLPNTPAGTKVLSIDGSGNLAALTGNRTIMVNAGAFKIDAGASFVSAGRVDLDASGAAAASLHAPLQIPVGSVITQLKFRVDKASDAGTGIHAYIAYWVDGTASTTFANADNAVNAPGATNVVSAIGATTVVAGGAYVLTLVTDDTSPSATDKFYHMEVLYTEPVV